MAKQHKSNPTERAVHHDKEFPPRHVVGVDFTLGDNDLHGIHHEFTCWRRFQKHP